MPATATVEVFLDAVKRGSVIDPERLSRYLEGLRRKEQLPVRPEELAQLLIRDGYLTRFQSQQFLAGRWQTLTLGKYQILEQIGRGKTGHVYLGKDSALNRQVAIKVLPPARVGSTTFRRFEREARAGASLDHPNIVKLLEFDRINDVTFLVMEYVEGVNLRELVKRSGPLEPSRAAHYIRQAAEGLQHLHAAGLIHRDMEPGNLLLDRQGTVKILDLGLARFESDVKDQLTIQQGARSLGTVDYMAPEQVNDCHAVDIRADIYALGATFYYLLTGLPPYGEGPPMQKLLWAQSREPEPLKTHCPDLPEELDALIGRLMKKDPAQRFSDPAEVVKALEPWTRALVAPPKEYIPRRGDTAPVSPSAACSSGTRGPALAAVNTAMTPSLNRPSNTRQTTRSKLVWILTFLLLFSTIASGLAMAIYVSFIGP